MVSVVIDSSLWKIKRHAMDNLINTASFEKSALKDKPYGIVWTIMEDIGRFEQIQKLSLFFIIKDGYRQWVESQ